MYAAEGVEGGIALLSRGKRRRFPVGKALPFGYPAPEEDAVDARQAVVDDSEILYVLLKVDESSGIEGVDSVEIVEVVVKRNPYLGYLLVLQQQFDRFGKSDHIEPEEKAVCACRKLEESNLMRLPFLETRARLGVEADYVRLTQADNSVFHSVG